LGHGHYPQAWTPVSSTASRLDNSQAESKLATADIVPRGGFCYAGTMDVNKRRVLLFGDSLILAGVRASLEPYAYLEIIQVDDSVENLLETIHSLSPAVIIFDLMAVQPGFQFSLLLQPGLLLVGIDPETQQAVVWSGRQEAAVAAADLIKIITPKD